MDPESKKILEETYRLVEENNSILHRMQRSLRIQRIMTAIYWIFIIGSALGVYYLIQPYVDQLLGVYSGAGDVIKNFKQLSQ